VEEDAWTTDEQGTPKKAGYTIITGVKNIDHLMRQMAPWYVRHLKTEQCCEHHPEGVMPWLPEKTYETIHVDLSPKQRKTYREMKQTMVAWVEEKEREGLSPLVATAVVAQLARLNQIALATPLMSYKMVNQKDKKTGEIEQVEKLVIDLIPPSSKIAAAMEYIQDHPDQQFLVFSSSKKAIYLLREQFNATKPRIPTVIFTGDQNDNEREVAKSAFIQGKAQVFAAVIEAAGEGVDGLQAATSTEIFLDRSWRTIKNMQAEDRAHRDGQKNAVLIVDIMARDTLDQGRHQKLEFKWSAIKAILGDRRVK
jgi:SWI/SNF-related matrix-associated actin-dependent regulator 1 of chromatin subfamily A